MVGGDRSTCIHHQPPSLEPPPPNTPSLSPAYAFLSCEKEKERQSHHQGRTDGGVVIGLLFAPSNLRPFSVPRLKYNEPLLLFLPFFQGWLHFWRQVFRGRVTLERKEGRTWLLLSLLLSFSLLDVAFSLEKRDVVLHAGNSMPRMKLYYICLPILVRGSDDDDDAQ